MSVRKFCPVFSGLYCSVFLSRRLASEMRLVSTNITESPNSKFIVERASRPAQLSPRHFVFPAPIGAVVHATTIGLTLDRQKGRTGAATDMRSKCVLRYRYEPLFTTFRDF